MGCHHSLEARNSALAADLLVLHEGLPELGVRALPIALIAVHLAPALANHRHRARVIDLSCQVLGANKELLHETRERGRKRGR